MTDPLKLQLYTIAEAFLDNSQVYYDTQRNIFFAASQKKIQQLEKDKTERYVTELGSLAEKVTSLITSIPSDSFSSDERACLEAIKNKFDTAAQPMRSSTISFCDSLSIWNVAANTLNPQRKEKLLAEIEKVDTLVTSIKEILNPAPVISSEETSSSSSSSHSPRTHSYNLRSFKNKLSDSPLKIQSLSIKQEQPSSEASPLGKRSVRDYSIPEGSPSKRQKTNAGTSIPAPPPLPVGKIQKIPSEVVFESLDQINVSNEQPFDFESLGFKFFNSANFDWATFDFKNFEITNEFMRGFSPPKFNLQTFDFSILEAERHKDKPKKQLDLKTFDYSILHGNPHKKTTKKLTDEITQITDLLELSIRKYLRMSLILDSWKLHLEEHSTLVRFCEKVYQGNELALSSRLTHLNNDLSSVQLEANAALESIKKSNTIKEKLNKGNLLIKNGEKLIAQGNTLLNKNSPDSIKSGNKLIQEGSEMVEQGKAENKKLEKWNQNWQTLLVNTQAAIDEAETTLNEPLQFVLEKDSLQTITLTKGKVVELVCPSIQFFQKVFSGSHETYQSIASHKSAIDYLQDKSAMFLFKLELPSIAALEEKRKKTEKLIDKCQTAIARKEAAIKNPKSEASKNDIKQEKTISKDEHALMLHLRTINEKVKSEAEIKSLKHKLKNAKTGEEQEPIQQRIQELKSLASLSHKDIFDSSLFKLKLDATPKGDESVSSAVEGQAESSRQ